MAHAKTGGRLWVLWLVVFVGCTSSAERLNDVEWKWGLSPGGRVRVQIEVANDLAEPVAPVCRVRAYDADDFLLASDVLTAENPIEPGKKAVYDEVTGIEIQETIPTDVRVVCGTALISGEE